MTDDSQPDLARGLAGAHGGSGSHQCDFRRLSAYLGAARDLAPRERRDAVRTEGRWSLNDHDPMDLLALSEPLRMAVGYTLVSYRYMAGGNAHGTVWAVPAGKPLPDPFPVGPRGPEPPDGLSRFMSVVEGDGSPWSYAIASLFAREARELGAMWHGVSWHFHTLVGEPGRPARSAGYAQEALAKAVAGRDGWTWHEPPPQGGWSPRVEITPDGVTVVFYTYSEYLQAAIYRHTDRYAPTGYDFQSERHVLATGVGGFIC